MTLETEFENDENDLNSKGSMLDEAANVSDISSNISGIEDVDISSICDEGETNSVAEGEKTGGLMEAKLNRTTKSGGDKEHIQVMPNWVRYSTVFQNIATFLDGTEGGGVDFQFFKFLPKSS